jgi:hypothetical protein
MPDPRFYVGAQDEHDNLTGYVPAKFLMRNGAYVMDPTPGGSQNAYLYSDASDANKTPCSIANPNNYLVVPANYTEEKARDFAGQIADMIGRTYPEDQTGTGLHEALGRMFGAFLRGSQDLQRNSQWGIPEGSSYRPFVGSASNHLGYVTGLAGLPKELSEIGGGVANGVNSVWQSIKKLGSSNIDTDGPFWLSKQNHANITQGFSDGVAASQQPAPFNDFGNGPQAQPAPDQIGDGNGIAPWISAMSGIDPQEPAPPAWPPEADTPIRYMSRRVQ